MDHNQNQNQNQNHNNNHSHSNENSPTSAEPRTRQRAKQACEPCRTRKRKCDGNEPCAVCTRYEYDCYYEAHSRKRTRANHTSPRSDHETNETIAVTSPLKVSRTPTAILDNAKMRYMEANSGIAFPQLLGQKLDASNAPRLHSFAWNLGVREEPRYLHTLVTQIISKEEMQRLAQVFFEIIHPLYGFIDRESFDRKVNQRWTDMQNDDPYDPVLCGVAALGSLFSGSTASDREADLVGSAKMTLETTSTLTLPSLDHVAAWILRCLYLRSTTRPHASWVASCTTMHTIEATGAHRDYADLSIVYPNLAGSEKDHEYKRRLFWIARVINTWISYEYGRSKVELRSTSCQAPSPRRGDFTTELVSLYQITERLDPDDEKEGSELEESLMQVEAFNPHHDALILSQTNLGICIYRRLRLINTNISKETLDRIISMGQSGLMAAKRVAELSQPWWHIANVPFQFICCLLAMDTRESLAQVGNAMKTLEAVSQRFNTHIMREAVRTAKLLVRLSQKQKEEDASLLKQGLKESEPITVRTPQDVTGYVMPVTTEPIFPQPDDLNLGVPDLSNFNWDLFLGSDIPIFEGGLPANEPVR